MICISIHIIFILELILELDHFIEFNNSKNLTIFRV